jgi:heavy metal sensor kinase
VIFDRFSLRARLTIGFAAALMAILTLSGGIVYDRVSADLDSTIDDALRARADDIAVIVESAPGGLPKLTSSRTPEVSNEEGFFQVLAPRGRVLATTLHPQTGAALDADQIRDALRESVIVDRMIKGIEGEARVTGRPARSGNGRLFVVVAGASTDDRREALRALARTFVTGVPLALLLSAALGYFLAGRSLRPVTAMRRRAREITLRRSGERLPLPRAEDEIRQLGETLNTMLDRIEGGIQRERVFVADASHELRTPLAILKTELELAGRRDRSRDELAAALGSAREEVDRLAQLAEDLLVIARSDQGQLTIARERTELSELLERVRNRFFHRAAERGREIAVDAPAGVFGELDPFRIEQALANLVENALRHGAGAVRLTARREGDHVVLEVSDEGPGFPEGFEQEAFERFTRADSGRSGGGSGLGLAIVRAIVAAHGGTVAIDASTGGAGATLRMKLPG